jgi:ABC-type branched-subunit amino acid transport system substrate-binding protein
MTTTNVGSGRLAIAAAVALATVLAMAPRAWALSEAQARGKQIYLQGTSWGGGDITALVGGEAVALPASAVPCASCHGPDGLGRPEGGVLPPDIRWSELTKAYDHVHADGRRHPPFDEAGLARLVRTGLDPANNRLDDAMPKYALSDGDMADLLAYLKHLGQDRDPGIEGDRIQVATLLPLDGANGALGRAMAQVMHAHFQEANERGGIFGRRLELLVIPHAESPEATLENLSMAFEQEGIFALVGAYTVGLDEEVLAALRARGAPLVGPFTLNPGDEIADASVFYLYPGFMEQARVLAEGAIAEGAARKAPILVAGPEGERVERLVAAVRDQVAGRGAPAPVTLRYSASGLEAGKLAERVRENASEAVLFFGDQAELKALLHALDARKQRPRVYLLSAFGTRALFEAPPAFHHRIFLAYPTLASDVTPAGRAAYGRLAEVHALPPDHLQGQIAAYAAARLLEEGLRRAGRDLSREVLVEGLEALYAYETGLTPPLSYGPNRRIGARGAHLVVVDLLKRTYDPVGGWQELH